MVSPFLVTKQKFSIARKGLPALALLCVGIFCRAQSAADILQKVRAKLETVTDYVAQGKMKTNVAFIKAPLANVKVYYKKPNRLLIVNETGISFIPKGSVNINMNNLFATFQHSGIRSLEFT